MLKKFPGQGLREYDIRAFGAGGVGGGRDNFFFQNYKAVILKRCHFSLNLILNEKRAREGKSGP